MTASNGVSTSSSSCSSGNSSSRTIRQKNKSRDPSARRHGDMIQTAFGVFRFAGLGNASAPASTAPTASGTSGVDSQVAAPAAAAGALNKLPHQSELDTPATGALRSEVKQQQRPAAIQNMLHTSWSSAAVVVDQVECHYRAVQHQLLQLQQQQTENLGDISQPVGAGSWSGRAARAAELLLCSLFAIIIFIVLGVVTVYAVLARGLQLLVLAAVKGISVGVERLKTRLRQQRAAASELGATAVAVQPPLAESDTSSSDDSVSSPSTPPVPSSHSNSSRSRPDTLDRLVKPEPTAASKTQQDHRQHQHQQLLQQPGAVGAIMSAIEQHTRLRSSCKGDSPSELQLRQLAPSQQQLASVSRGASAPLSEAEISPAVQSDAAAASLAPSAAQVQASGLASYAADAQQYAATFIQSVHDTAEAAALVVSAYLVRAAYTISWFLLRRWQLFVAHVTQYGYTHGLILAEHLCCRSLWVIGCLAADSSLVDSPQLSKLQAQLIKVVKTGSVTAAKAAQWGLATGEVFVSKLTSELLRDASPVTQTAVWGLAGMVRRNVVETCGLCWQLLVALSQVYIAQQQQLVAQ